MWIPTTQENVGAAVDSVILGPDSSLRNVIQPTAATFIPLVVKGFAAQSAAVFQVQDSTAAPKLSISQNGTITFAGSGTTVSGVVGGVTTISGLIDCGGIASAGNNYFDKYGDTNIHSIFGAASTVVGQKVTIIATQATKIALALKAAGSQSANIMEVQDSTTAVLSGFSKDGYWFTKKIAAPADGDLVASQVMIWFDDTNGAAKLMIKAKEAGGTVRTGEVALT